MDTLIKSYTCECCPNNPKSFETSKGKCDHKYQRKKTLKKQQAISLSIGGKLDATVIKNKDH
jgi:hypothetical protein